MMMTSNFSSAGAALPPSPAKRLMNHLNARSIMTLALGSSKHYSVCRPSMSEQSFHFDLNAQMAVTEANLDAQMAATEADLDTQMAVVEANLDTQMTTL